MADLNEVLAEAREELRRTGGVLPRLIVEPLRGSEVVMVFGLMPEAPATKRALMMLAGYNVAGGAPEESGTMPRPVIPVRVIHVAEAWFVKAEQGESLQLPLSRHPRRQEAVTVVAMTPPPAPQVTLVIQTFRRAANGIVFDEPDTAPGTEAEADLLGYFWLGVEMAHDQDNPDVRIAVRMAQLLVGGDMRMINLDDYLR